MAVIREVTFGDGTVVRITDWGDYPIYSRFVATTQNLAAELNQTQYLFNYTIGGQMPMTNARATIADTNMPGASQLPMGHQMLVYSLQVIPDEFAQPAVNGVFSPLSITPEGTFAAGVWKWRKIMFQTFLQLRIEQTKSFVDGRLDHFPMGGGVEFQCGAPVTDAYDVGNGNRTWQATRRLAMPIHLGSLETFYVSLDWPRGGLDYHDANSSTYWFEEGFGLTVRLTGPRQRPTA
jgi:hypothetical protein